MTTSTVDQVDTTVYATVDRLGPEPITAQEVSQATGIEISMVRKVLKRLAADGVLYTRRETRDERRLRFNGHAAKATAANLYSAQNPVPERTRVEVVPGFVASYKIPERLGSVEVRRRLGETIKSKPYSWTFTCTDLAAASGVPVGTIQHKMRSWFETGVVAKVNGDSRQRGFKVKITDHTALLSQLGVKLDGDDDPSTKRRRARKPKATTPPEADPVLVTVSHDELAQMVQKTQDLEMRIAELEAENAELKARPAGQVVVSLAEFLK